MSRVVDSGFFIAGLTAFLFSLSLANYNGYFSSLGVQPDFVSMSSRQILYNSLFVMLLPAISFAFISFLCFGALRGIATIYTEVARNNFEFKRILVKIRRFFGHHYNESKAERYWGRKLDKVAPVCLMVGVFFGALLYSEYEGKKEGRELLQRISSGDYEKKKLVSLSGYNSDVLVIACGDSNCAGITVEDKKIVYFENSFSPGEISNVTSG